MHGGTHCCYSNLHAWVVTYPVDQALAEGRALFLWSLAYLASIGLFLALGCGLRATVEPALEEAELALSSPGSGAICRP
jgi:hypothetical protein